VNLASDANVKILAEVPNLVNIADSDSNLVLIFDIRIIFLKLLEFSTTYVVKIVVLDHGCFLHKLSHSVNTLFVERLMI